MTEEVVEPAIDPKLYAAVEKGAIAQNELRLTNEAYEEVKHRLQLKWLSTQAHDTAGREKLWLSTCLLSQVQNVMLRHVRDGQIAEKEIEAIRKAAKHKRLAKLHDFFS